MIKESFGNIIIYYITIKDRLTLDGLAKTISKSLHLKYPDSDYTTPADTDTVDVEQYGF
jgi:hypothetical protein